MCVSTNKMRPKQIIIDKSAFHGISTLKLEIFVRGHFLILPDDLYYECVTHEDYKKREELLARFREITYDLRNKKLLQGFLDNLTYSISKQALYYWE